MLKFLVLGFTALGLGGCAANAQGAGPTLAGSEWGGEFQQQFIQFKAGGVVTGNGGCNQFSGRYEQSGGRLAIGPLRATKMACENLPQERLFFRALEQTAYMEKQGIVLSLTDKNGALVLTLRHLDWD